MDDEFVWGREEFMRWHNHIFQKTVDSEFVWGREECMRWRNHVFLGSQHLGNEFVWGWKQFIKLHIAFKCMQSLFLKVMCLSIRIRWIASLFEAEKNQWNCIITYFKNQWITSLFQAEKNSWYGVIMYFSDHSIRAVSLFEAANNSLNYIFSSHACSHRIWRLCVCQIGAGR